MVAKGYKFHDADAMRAELGVDARLDNRVGSARPVREKDPAVPQQVDGPDLVHQAEHAEAVEKLAVKAEDKVDRRGMNSPGDHSLGDEDARRGNDAGQADKLKETDPANPGSASTDAAKNPAATVRTAPSA